jgi:hypothetical protein
MTSDGGFDDNPAGRLKFVLNMLTRGRASTCNLVRFNRTPFGKVMMGF